MQNSGLTAMKKMNAKLTVSVKRLTAIWLAASFIGISADVVGQIGETNAIFDEQNGIWLMAPTKNVFDETEGNVFQNDRSSQFQLGIGEIVMDALNQGHPVCYKRLTNTYPLRGRVLVSKDGEIDDQGNLNVASTEAFLCAMAISNLVTELKSAVIGVVSPDSLRDKLAWTFKSRLGTVARQVRDEMRRAGNGRPIEFPGVARVKQEAAFRQPYFVAYDKGTRSVSMKAMTETGMNELKIAEEGGYQNSDTLMMDYYAVDRVTGYMASFGSYTMTYEDGAHSVKRGGRVWFDLSRDIVAGYAVTVSESGSLSFDVVR